MIARAIADIMLPVLLLVTGTSSYDTTPSLPAIIPILTLQVVNRVSCSIPVCLDVTYLNDSPSNVTGTIFGVAGKEGSVAVWTNTTVKWGPRASATGRLKFEGLPEPCGYTFEFYVQAPSGTQISKADIWGVPPIANATQSRLGQVEVLNITIKNNFVCTLTFLVFNEVRNSSSLQVVFFSTATVSPAPNATVAAYPAIVGLPCGKYLDRFVILSLLPGGVYASAWATAPVTVC